MKITIEHEGETENLSLKDFKGDLSWWRRILLSLAWLALIGEIGNLIEHGTGEDTDNDDHEREGGFKLRKGSMAEYTRFFLWIIGFAVVALLIAIIIQGLQ